MRAAALAAVLCCVAANAHAGAGGDVSPAQQALSDGNKAFDSEDYATAETKYKETINIDSTVVEAYSKLASIYYRQKKYADAIAICRRSSDQQNLDLREQLGLALYKANQIPEAVKVLEGVVAQDPTKFGAQLQLGLHYIKGEPKKAAAALEAYLKNRRSDENALKMDPAIKQKLASAYFGDKDYDSAIRIFDELLHGKPNDVNLMIALATTYTAKRDIDAKACDKAITLFEKVLGEANKQPVIYLYLGRCYLKNNRAADAQREAELYTRAKPNDENGQLLLGDAYLEMRNWNKALMAFLQAQNLDQTNGAIKTRLGKAYLGLKNYGAAVTVLEQANKAAPNDTEVLCDLAEAYASAGGQPKDKLTALGQKLVAVKEARAQAAAGQMFWVTGVDDRAADAYHAALAIDSANGVAKVGLVKVLNRRAGGMMEKNDATHALGLLEEAQRLQPDELMTNRNLGIALLALKRWPDAETAFSRPLKKVPSDMFLNRLIARAYLGQAKTDKAIAAYEKAAQIALRTRGADLVGVYAELGPLYADNGKLDLAVTVLEQAVKEANGTALANLAQRNLSIVYFRRGIERMRNPKEAEGALDDITHALEGAPKGAFTAKESNAMVCGEAFAALKANKILQAEQAFTRAVAAGGCPLKPPFDKLGVQFFAAYAGYRDSNSPSSREVAAKTFAQLQAKAQGGTAEWLRQLLRSSYELLAYDYFQRSDEKKAEAYLKNAKKVPSKGEVRDLENNWAAIDLTAGRTAVAEKTLEALNGRPAEALVNLGIIYDKQGDAKKALEYYKRASERGARAPRLKEWIDVKERLFEAKP